MQEFQKGLPNQFKSKVIATYDLNYFKVKSDKKKYSSSLLFDLVKLTI